MRWWLILSIFGYATKAVPTIVDKALFHTKAVKHPGTYAVAVSAIGGLVLLLAPFFLTWPTWHIVVYALLSGAAFTMATLFFFSALQRSDASRVTPFIGAVVSMVTAALAYLSLDERLAAHQVIAFACLVAGGILVTRGRGHGEGLKGKAIYYCLAAAACFAFSLVMSKAAFDRMPGAFLSAIIWMRAGSLVTGGILVLCQRRLWAELRSTTTGAVPKKAKWAFLGGQLSGAVSGLLIYGAIALGTPTLVNAMQGLEYLFVLIFSGILVQLHPKLVGERFTRRSIPTLAAAVVLIGFGLVLLTH
jgi:drug/metabolite transporter (DMT)-like permease